MKILTYNENSLVEEQAEIIKKLLVQAADFDKKKEEWGITIFGMRNVFYIYILRGGSKFESGNA